MNIFWMLRRFACLAPEDGGTGGGGDGDDGEVADVPGDESGAADGGEGGDEPAGGAGILDRATGAKAADDGAADDAAPEPGTTARPENVPEKFWDAKTGAIRSDALLKSYLDAEKKLGSGAGKAPAKPEDYRLEPSDALKEKGVVGYDMKDPALSAALAAAAANGVTNQQMNAIAAAVMGVAADQDIGVDPAKVVEREFKKLGPNAQSIVDGVDGWLHGMAQSGVLSDTELSEARFMAGTALGTRVMVKLMEASGEAPIPLRGGHVDGLPSKEELYAMVADPKYYTDTTFRKKVDGMMERAFGTQEAGSSQAGLGV